MKKIIIDCDNTFGVEGCDIDDGLAIIYALGSGKCDCIGITTTFGNNTLEVVHPNTVQFMKHIGRSQIPVYKGHGACATENEAAKFLVEMANRYPGDISLLATGSMTNLYHAFILDNLFYDKLDELSLMGGITEPLIINGKILNELNFSCDYEASFNVFTYGKNIKIATGNSCLDALFLKDEFDALKTCENVFAHWLHDKAEYWFKREKEVFGHAGIYKWDVFATATLLNPHLFDEHYIDITPDLESLTTGCLLGGGKARQVKLPKIKDSEQYIKHVYAVYKNFSTVN